MLSLYDYQRKNPLTTNGPQLIQLNRSILDITVEALAICHTCNKRHKIKCSVTQMTVEGADWEKKHPAWQGCKTEYISKSRLIPRNFNDKLYKKQSKAPWFLNYAENVNFTFGYRASAPITNAISALATSATWVAGYESATIDNSTNKDLDILVSAKVTVGTTPTINTVIEINSVSMQDDTNWPDVFDGTTSAETVTSVGVKNGICLPYDFLNVDATTTNRIYYITKRSTAALYAGICPDKSVLFTAHNTGVALKTEVGTDHQFFQQGAYIIG